MSAPVTSAGRVLLDGDDAGRIAVVLHHQRLDVEHDVGHVLEHAGDRGELVLGAANLDLRDGAAFQAGKQHAPQAVADRRAEAALERLGDEFAVGAGQRCRHRTLTMLGSSNPRQRICIAILRRVVSCQLSLVSCDHVDK